MSDTPITDAFPMRIIEREIHDVVRHKGISLNDGKVRLDISHVQRLISLCRQIERDNTRLRACLQWYADGQKNAAKEKL